MTFVVYCNSFGSPYFIYNGLPSVVKPFFSSSILCSNESKDAKKMPAVQAKLTQMSDFNFKISKVKQQSFR